MAVIGRSGLAALAALVVSASSAMANCQNGLGVSRIVEIDATAGPVFGMITKQTREERFLGPKEVVLTFDDGPMPGVTRPILETLDRYCTKATFFSVGKMAIAYPEQTREILRRGHTLGTHTWSHPMSLPRLKGRQALDQIESGFAAVAMAAGQPIAPFFRFPGLNDSPSLIAHLESRNIATFTVDVVSNDSYISDPERLIERTLQQLDAEKGGIMLFHDIKPQTARALPTILAEIKARGYRVVHLRAKAPFVPDAAYADAVQTYVAAKNPAAMRQIAAFTDTETPPAPAESPPPAPAVTSRPLPGPLPATTMPPSTAAAMLEPGPARRAPRSRARQPALAETSSWAVVVAEPKAEQPPQAKPTIPANSEPAEPHAVAQAAGDWPEVRRNGRVIRVEKPRQPVGEAAAIDAKPAAVPAPSTAYKAAPRTEAKPAPVVVAPPVAALVAAPKTTPEPKPVVATTPSTPQKPRIINASEADASPPATATTAVGPGTSAEKPAAQSTPGKPADATAAVTVSTPAVAVPATPPSPGGTGVEVLAGAYTTPAASVAPSSQTAADPSPTAGRFAAPEIIAGSYREQPTTPVPSASQARRNEGTTEKRAP